MKEETRNKLESFLQRKDTLEKLRRITSEGKRSLELDFDNLLEYDMDLANYLLNNPTDFLEAADKILEDVTNLPRTHLRVKNLSESARVEIRKIRSEHVEKFIQIEGVLTRGSDVRPEVTEAVFKCRRCGEETKVLQTGNFFRKPIMCGNPNCGKKGPFDLVMEESEFCDWQSLRIQERPEKLRGGRIPRSLGGIVRDDFVDKATPGNRVVVTGILHAFQEGRRKTQKTTFRKILEVNHIEVQQVGVEEAELSPEDEEEIEELAEEHRIDNMIIDSIAPSIFGYEREKEAIALQLFGCSAIELPDGSRIRGDPHVLLTGDPGTAKCVSGDTKVILSNGEVAEIREVVNEGLSSTENGLVDDGMYARINHELPTLAPNASVQTGKATIAWKRTAPNHMYKVKTRTGKTIRITPTHPFFTLVDGHITQIRAQELQSGDFIATPRELPISGARQKINVEIKRGSTNATHIKIPKRTSGSLCKIIGYLFAEGTCWWTDSSCIVAFNNKNEVLNADYSKSFLDVFGINPSTPPSHRKKKDLWAVSVELGQFIQQLVPQLFLNSPKRIVPPLIMRCSRREIASFLRAYFDGEATISTKEREIVVVSASRELLEQIRHLLLRFGILSQIHTTVSRATNVQNSARKTYYRLRISGAAVEKYAREIGFIHPGKKRKLSKWASSKIAHNPNLDVVPNVGDVIRQSRKDLGMSQSELELPKSMIKHYERGDRFPSRHHLRVVARNLRKRLDELKSEENFNNTIRRLELLANSKVFWDRVEEVEVVAPDEDWVYDLQVDDTHNFVANDVFVHNSQLLKWVAQVAPRGIYTSGKKATGAGLCVAPDSLIMLNDGTVVEIGEFVSQSIESDNSNHGEIVAREVTGAKSSISLDVDELRNSARLVEKVWRLPAPESLIRIETRMGRRLTITPENPLLVMKSDGPTWVEAKDLKEGDFVATHRAVKVKNGTPSPLISWIDSRVFVAGIADFVSELVRELKKKYGSIRMGARKLGMSEDALYYRWRRDDVRGNPSLSALLSLAEEAGLGLHEIAEHIETLRQPNGTIIRIPTYPNPDFTYFVGMIAADGHIGITPWGGREIRFFSNDEEVLRKYLTLVESQFGVKPKMRQDGGRTPEVRFHSKLVAELLEKFGVPRGEKSHVIDIPPHLTTLPDDTLAAYLRGLFDCDGSIVKRSGRGSSYIEYSTTSEELARKLQLLLLRFGIVAKLRARNSERVTSEISGHTVTSKRPRWEIIIRGLSDLLQFQDKIGFANARKKSKLSQVISSVSWSNTNLDVIPNAGSLVRKARKALEVSPTKLYGRTSHKLERNEMQPSREFLTSLVNKLEPVSADGGGIKEFALLRNLASSDIYWDSIKKIDVIRDHGIEHVYDLTVRGAHNFMVNGIVVHNTAAAVRDEIGGGWTLEAGALAIADGGLASIDEFDKMDPQESGAILESMEQQTISIAKAGIVATLNTRTAILAAANPRLGRFDEFVPIAQQIDLPALILSRFDLIFILRDLPTEERDRSLANHMLWLHSRPDEVVKPKLDMNTLRKVVIYARKHKNPKLTDEKVKKKLEDFFVRWRKASGKEVIPITARQLEGLVRLSKASARMRLSDKVELEDAERAINLVEHSLREVGFDTEAERVDIDTIMTGHTRTQRDKFRTIMRIIQRLEEEYEGSAPIKIVKEEARGEGISREFVDEMIRREKEKGRLYEPKEGVISRAVR